VKSLLPRTYSAQHNLAQTFPGPVPQGNTSIANTEPTCFTEWQTRHEAVFWANDTEDWYKELLQVVK